MRWLIFASVLLLGGCNGFPSSNGSISVHESLTLMNYTIAASADGAGIALDAGVITVREACAVEQYGTLAGEIVDQAWVSVFRGDFESAEGQIALARSALTGVSVQAQALVADHCGGTP